MTSRLANKKQTQSVKTSDPVAIRLNRANNRRNILTPPPPKVKISRSYLDEEKNNRVDINDDDEVDSIVKKAIQSRNNRTMKQNVNKDVSIKDETVNEVINEVTDEMVDEVIDEEETRVNQYQNDHQDNHQESITENTRRNNTSSISLENTLAKYGYKAMDKLVLHDKVIYIKCVNTNGHTVFVDIQGSEYENDVDGNKVIHVKIVSVNDDSENRLQKDLKEKSYKCASPELNGVIIMYDNYYLTLNRNGHHIDPKEVTYVTIDSKRKVNECESLIPFPIVNYEDILEDFSLLDSYVHSVVDRIYDGFYRHREEEIKTLLKDITDLSTLTSDYYDEIVERINLNNSNIEKLQQYKEKCEDNPTKENKSNLRMIIFDLRVLNIVDRENLCALTRLINLSKDVKMLTDKISNEKIKYTNTVEDHLSKIEEKE